MAAPGPVKAAFEVVRDHLASFPYSPEVAKARALLTNAEGLVDSLPTPTDKVTRR